MSDNKDDISKILDDFKTQKEIKERDPMAPLEPPKPRQTIDFSKNDTDDVVLKNGKTPEDIEKKKQKKAERNEKFRASAKKAGVALKKTFTNKKVLISIGAVLLAVLVVIGIVSGVNASKTAYLKPYKKEYPKVNFPEGILEEYCDLYGKNPNATGYIEIPEIGLKSAVLSSSSKTYPKEETVTEGAQRKNFVIYLNDSKLEDAYKNADAYNKSSGYIKYSDLFTNYNFRVAGAFYTNTNPEDDNGYVFPYNVTEKMTLASATEFAASLDGRFVYDTGFDITRNDKFLIISCPTDYRKDYRFVLVAVMRDSAEQKEQATDISQPRVQQVIYDERHINNPYKFMEDWYPEIVITDAEGNEQTVKKSLEDYWKSSKKK